MKKLSNLLTAIFIASSMSAFAASSNDTITLISKNLQNNLPDLKIDKIMPTKFDGVYEVDSGRKVFYVDKTGNYALIGNMLDLQTKASITEQRTSDLNIIDWNKLLVESSIVKIKGTGENKIAIFTDPDCPFCKRLEAETVSKLNNVTIYYYLFPLDIHPTAAIDSKKILCAENPESAMQAYMIKGSALGKISTCNNAKKLTTMQNLGNNLVQVTGTPTIILPNGRIVSGLIPADYLTRLIDENKLSSKESAIITTKK